MYQVPKLDDYSPALLDKAFDELRAAFDAEARGPFDEADWKAFRDRWLGRKSGILTQVNEQWLKAAPPEAKREVGRRLNELRGAIETGVESARGASAAQAGAAAKGDIDIRSEERRVGKECRL